MKHIKLSEAEQLIDIRCKNCIYKVLAWEDWHYHGRSFVAVSWRCRLNQHRPWWEGMDDKDRGQLGFAHPDKCLGATRKYYG